MPRLPTSPAAVPAPEIEHPNVLFERAIKAEHPGRRDEAIELYRRLLRIDPTNLAVINRFGAFAGEVGELSIALQQFRNSVRIDPNQPEPWYNLGVAQSRLGRGEEALTSFGCAIALAPLYAAAHLQRGATLARLGRFGEALAAFNETIRLSPDDPLTALHRGWTLPWCGEFNQARSEFERAIASRPDFAEAWTAKSMLLLLLGDLPGGFALYEWRWRMASRLRSPRREYAQPLWLGEPGIEGKTLLIYKEQGFGDVIQFCRYATLAADAGARVIVEVQPNLTALMATLRGVFGVISEDEPLPDHDCRCPMMSLPLAFGTTLETIPAPVLYLHADPQRASEWRKRLAGLTGRRIGLVWGAGHRVGDSELAAQEQRVSVPLAALAPLVAEAGCEFVSIQLGPSATQAATLPPGMVLHDFTRYLNDYADTAALMDNLDLVISVDTSTAHLAGALGKPVWLLNRFDTEWRWLLDRDDSPWYPTMRIFRQPKPGDWASVVQSVADALRLFVAG